MNQLTLCKQRKKIYELLSYCLLNVPTDEQLQMMVKGQEILKDLIEDGKNANYSIETSNLEKYVQEYYDRFFVPNSSLFIPPYESAVRNRSVNNSKIKYGKLDGKETFHVKVCYEMVSFKPQELNMFKPLKDIRFPDHIAYEVAFMTFLVSEEENSLIDGKEKDTLNWRNLQSQFLREHLCKWINDFAVLSEEIGKGLYSFWLNLCSVWIKTDNDFLVQELESEKE